MNLTQLRSFVTVCKTLNFTNAARQIGVPQSTISRQINDLEEQLQVRLFHRTKRDVQLTSEGRTFLTYAQDIIDTAQNGINAVKQLNTGAKGRLSIATIDTSGDFMINCLQTFVKKYPDIMIDIHYISSSESLLDNDNPTYDFYFMYHDMIPENDEFETVITHEDRLCIVLPADHRISDKLPDAIDLQEEKFIMVSEEENPILYMHVMNFCRSRRFFPNIINRANDPRAVMLSISSGLGISIMPESFVRNFNMKDTIKTIPIETEATSILCAAAWKKSLLNPAAVLFLKIIEDLTASTEL